MLLLLLTACNNDYEIVKYDAAVEPLSLTVTSPTYGEFLGSTSATVTGVVTPPTAWLRVNDVTLHPDADGNFSTTVTLSDRAAVIDVHATTAEQESRQLIPVFDGDDPRFSDPGAVSGLLTATGLDALEGVVESSIDALGWEDQLMAAIPSYEGDYFSIVPSSVTSSGADVDLSASTGTIGITGTLSDVTIVMDASLFDYLTFSIEASLGTITIGANAAPSLEDDMLYLTLSEAVVEMGEPNLVLFGYDLPDWVDDYILEPALSLLAGVGDLLADTLLSEYGTLELGGPFAFSFDLMGTQLSAQLASLETSLDGVNLGATIGYNEDAAETLPDGLTQLVPTTPSGLSYQLGLAVHEGMFNTLMDELLAGFLDFELVLEGDYAEIMGAGFAALPGGEQMPAEAAGYCLDIHTGDARVVRMVSGTGAPLARAYLPDLQVVVQTLNGDTCTPWLSAQLFATADMNFADGSIALDLGVADGFVLYYGATGVDEDEVVSSLGGIVTSFASLLGGSLAFDLGDLGLIDGVTLNPTMVAVEPLDEEGLFGLYLNVF